MDILTTFWLKINAGEIKDKIVHYGFKIDGKEEVVFKSPLTAAYIRNQPVPVHIIRVQNKKEDAEVIVSIKAINDYEGAITLDVGVQD